MNCHNQMPFAAARALEPSTAQAMKPGCMSQQGIKTMCSMHCTPLWRTSTSPDSSSHGVHRAKGGVYSFSPGTALCIELQLRFRIRFQQVWHPWHIQQGMHMQAYVHAHTHTHTSMCTVYIQAYAFKHLLNAHR